MNCICATAHGDWIFPFVHCCISFFLLQFFLSLLLLSVCLCTSIYLSNNKTNYLNEQKTYTHTQYNRSNDNWYIGRFDTNVKRMRDRATEGDNEYDYIGWIALRNRLYRARIERISGKWRKMTERKKNGKWRKKLKMKFPIESEHEYMYSPLNRSFVSFIYFHKSSMHSFRPFLSLTHIHTRNLVYTKKKSNAHKTLGAHWK